MRLFNRHSRIWSSPSVRVIIFFIDFAGLGFSVRLAASIFISSLFDLISIAAIFPYLRLVTDADSLHQVLLLFPWTIAYDRRYILIGLSLAIVSIYLIKGLLQALLLRYQHSKLAAVMSALSDDAVNKLLHAKYSYFQETKVSDIGATVFTDPIYASGVFRALLQMVNEMIFIGLLFAIFLIASPVFTLFVLVALVLIGSVLYLRVVRNTALLGKDQANAEKARYRVLWAMINSMRDIKVMGLADLFESFNKKNSVAFEDISWRYNYNSALPLIAIEVTVLVGVVFMVMAMIVFDFTIADAIPVVGFIGVASARLVPATAKFFMALNSFRFHRESVIRFIDMRRQLMNVRHNKVKDELVFEKDIIASEIDFAYGSHSVLVGISLTLRRGFSYGIVGASGSGKSTLLDILTGLRAATNGKFFCDGVPFDPFYSNSLSRLVGYVPQNITLLDETIAFNIAFSHAYDVARMSRAIRLANLEDFVASLPSGIETQAGENGNRFSGGQRQRIGIARALYRGPNILVLDEATSALDPITEKEIAIELASLRGDITQLAVTHRISAVEDCDEIFVMADGRIVARGSHVDLLDISPLYKELFLSQTGAQSDGIN